MSYAESPDEEGAVKLVGNTAIGCVIMTAGLGLKGPVWAIGGGVVSLCLIGLACWFAARDDKHPTA